MPRPRYIRNKIHRRIRQALAFFLNHILVNRMAGVEMGVLVERFVIERLRDIREVVLIEIENLAQDNEEGYEEETSSEDEPAAEAEP